MNTTYIAIAIIILVAAVVAVAYLAQTRPSAPSVGVGEKEINALGEYEPLNVEQEIGTDVLPSETELNIDVNDVTMELPENI